MSESANIICIDPHKPDKADILKAANIIRSKGLVIIPTQCLYGIGACALKDETVKKVFQLKQRPSDNPVLVLVPDSSFVNTLVTYVPKTAELLMNAFWPGGLTLLYQAAPHIPGSLTAGTGKIGIRVPLHPVAKALLDTLAFPISGTSANISGRPGCSHIDLLDPEIRAGADLILDAGILRGGSGSTIIDVTVSPIRIIREGIVKKEEIFRVLSQN